MNTSNYHRVDKVQLVTEISKDAKYRWLRIVLLDADGKGIHEITAFHPIVKTEYPSVEYTKHVTEEPIE